MSLLFKHLRVHQIFGANTDVGKTVLTSALIRASASQSKDVFYLKPVSTGPSDAADDEYVKRFTSAYKDRVKTYCAYTFDEPVSPHLAARMAQESRKEEVAVPTDQELVEAIAVYSRLCAERTQRFGDLYVETAGGVHSPTVSGTTQLDAYRPLFFPSILIGDSKLGGISSTISAYESMQLRGYIVDAVLLFRDSYYKNWEYLSSYFAERGVHVSSVRPPPKKLLNPADNFITTQRYYKQIVPTDREDGAIFDVLHHLDDVHHRRLAELESMPRRTLVTVWWPFVQHGHVKDEKDVTVIDSATTDFFSVYGHKSGRDPSSPNATEKYSLLEPQFDGSASWWTQTVGHAHPALALAAARAAGRYGHVMFPQATHLPALRLAERLIKEGPGKGWASRAFFSDDGSTAVEVALKMALRTVSVRDGLDRDAKKSLGIVGLKGSYHGDTIGAMDACEEGVYTCEWHNAKGYWFEPPAVSIKDNRAMITLPTGIAVKYGIPNPKVRSLAWVYDVPARLQTPLAETYRTFISHTLRSLSASGQKLGALVLEPLVLGAGGMVFVDPLFQRVLVDTAREQLRLPVIFDEVFVGLHRVGPHSAVPLLGVAPDVSVHAKILTGGLVPLAVTLATDAVFQAFVGESKAECLLHGHSYTAHAVGCEVANETLNLIEKVVQCEEWASAKETWAKREASDASVFSLWEPDFVYGVSTLAIVDEVMALGTVLAIKVRDTQGGYVSHSAQELLKCISLPPADALELSSAPGGAPYGIHFRTLGNVAYFMTSLNTSPATIRAVQKRIRTALKKAGG